MKTSFVGSIGDFARDPRHGIGKNIAFNLIWAKAAAEFDGFALLSYEQLYADTRHTLFSILRFFEAGDRKDLVDHAVERFSFERMQHDERHGSFQMRYGSRLAPGNINNPNSYKVRRGKVGSHLDELPSEDLSYCNEELSRTNYFGLIGEYASKAMIGSLGPQKIYGIQE